MKFDQIFLVVLDSLGIGAMPDAAEYGDAGTSTLKRICEGGIKIPHLEKLGIARLGDFGLPKPTNTVGYGRVLRELSVGKDTMTGHWEIMGLEVKEPFNTFTDTGFPQELMDLLEKETNTSFIGNCAASGTEIIKELGEESIRTGKAIIYTSADSVLQIAAHEEHFGLERLYQVCEIARKLTLTGKYRLGRVIARPFIGESAATFKRTSNRHDYALSPTSATYLDYLKEAGQDVIAIGKIFDIFNGQGLTEGNKTVSNEDGLNKIIAALDRDFTGLVFANLVDFDMEYGHRRNIAGYRQCLEQFDVKLGEMMAKMKDNQLLILCADHGNDPGHTGSDHTREKIPFLLFSPAFKETGFLGEGATFADIGALIADNFGIKAPLGGVSVLEKLI